jgi:hypothetical protein
MKKIKNYFRSFILLIAVSLMLFNCQKDDILLSEVQQDLVIKKDLKEKLEQKDQKTFDYKTLLDWKKSFNFNGITYIPIKENIKLFDFFGVDKAKIKKKSKIFSFLTIKLEEDNSLTNQIRLFIDFKERNNIDNKTLLELNYIVLSENLEFIESSFKRKESKKGILSKNECQLWGVYRIITYSNGDREEELLYTFEICDGAPIDEEQTDDSGGGGGGDSEADSFLVQNVWNTQDPYDKWNRLTECEKDFFRSNLHHLINARANRTEAENTAFQRFGNCITPNNRPMLNTIGDAYRHAYFAALNTHNMGYTNAKALGDAHECNTPSNELDQKQMDLHNNAWGYHYGSTVTFIDEDQFYNSFMIAFNSGQIKILQACE